MLPAHAAPEHLSEYQQGSCIGSSQGYYAEFSRPGVLIKRLLCPRHCLHDPAVTAGRRRPHSVLQRCIKNTKTMRKL